MSIDTTFHPITPTFAFDNSAVLTMPDDQTGYTTYRIRALTASGYFHWAPRNSPAPAAAVAPALGAPQPNTLGVTLNVPFYVELPPGAQFIGNATFATSGFEITGGIGGVGG